MSATLDQIAAFLDGLGIGSVGATLFKGSRPDSPDALWCLYEYPGFSPEYVQESQIPSNERPMVQVLTRSLDYEAASDMAWQAWTPLSQVRNADLSGTRYRSIRPNGSPASLGRDANDRSLIAFNIAIEKEVDLVGVS